MKTKHTIYGQDRPAVFSEQRRDRFFLVSALILSVAFLGSSCEQKHSNPAGPADKKTETRKQAVEGGPAPEPEGSVEYDAIDFPSNDLGSMLEYHVFVLHGDGTTNYHENYLESIVALKDHPDTIPTLVQLFDQEQVAHNRWILVQILADLDDCGALQALENIGGRSHPIVGDAPCHGCWAPNEFELYISLRAINGLERLLDKSCSAQAESALETLALGAQSSIARHNAVAILKIVAGQSVSELQQLLPQDEEWFAQVSEWDVLEVDAPIPQELESPEETNAPERGF